MVLLLFRQFKDDDMVMKIYITIIVSIITNKRMSNNKNTATFHQHAHYMW